LIGVVHLRALPGAPDFRGDMGRVVEAAVADARAYATGGADAVIVENFGDVPFTAGAVPAETVAAMAVAGAAVRAACGLPLGFNVLRNDAHAALALCAACGGAFVRVNVHTGAMLTDQGVIEGKAFATMRARAVLAPGAKLLADVQVKHAVPVAPMPIELSAMDTASRGRADALIVSGTGTGQATAREDVERVRAACPEVPVLIGSGITRENVRDYAPWADGVIVGTSLKRSGDPGAPVDARRVAALARAWRA
jgi:hypothetical protein